MGTDQPRTRPPRGQTMLRSAGSGDVWVTCCSVTDAAKKDASAPKIEQMDKSG